MTPTVKEIKQAKGIVGVGNVTVNIEEVTPQLAKQYLDKNYDNRKQSHKHVDWLASQMESNAWMLTHQGIAFDVKGHLRDGQHRLQAIINSMTNQFMVVVRGLDAKTFTVMDTGKLRNAADVLFIEGFSEYPRQTAAMCRGLLEWEHGQYRSVGKSTTRITNFMILQYAKKNRGMGEILKRFMSMASTHSGIMNGTLSSTFSWIFANVENCDQKTANDFFERIYTGANLGEHSPELYLRNWLQQEKFQLHKASRQYKMAMIIKGWNYYRKNTPILKMWAWKPKDEIFPIPV